jgi:hypothetical protein
MREREENVAGAAALPNRNCVRLAGVLVGLA